MNARAGAHIDHMVRQADRLFVMLHDEDRIAEVAQPEAKTNARTRKGPRKGAVAKKKTV